MTSTCENLGSAIATESPMITPLPGAKLYKLTAKHRPVRSVKQNVLEKMRLRLGNKTNTWTSFHGRLLFDLNLKLQFCSTISRWNVFPLQFISRLLVRDAREQKLIKQFSNQTCFRSNYKDIGKKMGTIWWRLTKELIRWSVRCKWLCRVWPLRRCCPPANRKTRFPESGFRFVESARVRLSSRWIRPRCWSVLFSVCLSTRLNVERPSGIEPGNISI